VESAGNGGQLGGKVAALEDELKIIKGEVKQVLTEIRSAVLAKDNPFDGKGLGRTAPAKVHIVPAAEAEPSRVEPILPNPEPEPPAVKPEPSAASPAAPPVARANEPAPSPASAMAEPEPGREPIAMTPRPSAAAVAAPAAPRQPRWSLLTIASLAAWAEDAMRKLGALRLEILLDLCEAAGYLAPESRAALARVTQLEVAIPEQPPAPTDTVVLLRQLDALLQGEREALPLRLHSA